MEITRTSSLTGKKHTRDINVTSEQLHRWHSGELIQNAMPNLSSGDREFLMTGITNEEWDEAFKESEDEDEYEHGTQADAFRFQFRI